MSFNNTRTKLLTEADPKKRKYVVPHRLNSRGRARVYYLTPELEAEFRRLFPITMNPDLIDIFGISSSTLHRFARELGLKKNVAVINKKHGAQVKRTCKKNGYYKSIKGKAPSEACIEAYKKKMAEGFHPMHQLQKTNPRRYKAVLKKRSERRKELIAKERRRYKLGFMPVTALPTLTYAGEQYGPRGSYIRNYAKSKGYLPGNPDPESGERHTIYYTDTTDRRPVFEKNAINDGFQFLPKPIRTACATFNDI